MSTLETIQEILIDQFDLTQEQLTPEVELARLGVDSLGVLDFMFKIEDRFSLRIKDDIPPLVTLNDVVVYIDALLARQSRVLEADATPVNPVR